MALMKSTDSTGLWESGITGISTDISYDTIMETCAQIWRDCIIQQCNGTSGNFALCRKTTDGKRSDVLARRACWQNVFNCVKQADNLNNMTYGILPSTQSPDEDQYTEARENYYSKTYSGQVLNGFNNCMSESDCISGRTTIGQIPMFCKYNSADQKEFIACLITEQIWGNCEHIPDMYDITENANLVPTTASSTWLNYSVQLSNKILIPSNGSTLLSWFAANTGTTNTLDSCNARGCPVNYLKDSSTGECTKVLGNCSAETRLTDTGKCPQNNNEIMNVTDTITNYCQGGVRDIYGNCCNQASSTKDSVNGICVPKSDNYESTLLQTVTCDGTGSDSYLCPNTQSGKKRKISAYCVHPADKNYYITYTTGDKSVQYYCTGGFWLLVDQYGNYFNLQGNTSPVKTVKMTYIPQLNAPDCTYGFSSGWQWTGSGMCMNNAVPTDSEFMISYEQIKS